MASVPDVAVGFLLENLKDFVAYNADLIAGGAEDNAKSLCNELELLKGFLKKVSEQNYGDNAFLAGFAKKVRRLVFKAEDAVDTYIAMVSKHKVRGAVKSALHSVDHAMELRNIAKELDAIKQEVQRLYKMEMERALMIMREVIHTDKVKNKVKDYEDSIKRMAVNEEDIVGCEDELENIIELLVYGSEELQVISITGMLGLGKTTMARRVCKDSRIQYHFQICIFVNVSHKCNTKQVLTNILHASAISYVKDHLLEISDEDLSQLVYKSLKGRRFLVVLDDVCSEDAWNRLKDVFPSDENGSRLLITTEKTTLANNASQIGSIRELRHLNHNESRELLRKRLFSKHDFPNTLEECEKIILDKCKGLPLAITIAAGTLLNHRDDINWWRKVANGVIADGEGLAAKEVIRLSFNQLPQHLKPCFLYLGLFREDSEIQVRTLLQLWMAEGLIQEDTLMCLEDVATKCLEDLVDRNLVMVNKRRSDGRIKTCKIHNTLYDFCKEEAKKENFFQDSKQSSLQDPRRISINYNVEEFLMSIKDAKSVRTLLSFLKENFSCPLEYTSSIPEACRLLRVLDITSIKLSRFPSDMCYLFLLRYLAISGSIKVLPEKLSKLCNLQTLITLTTERTLEIKAGISKMPLLRHIYSNASIYLQTIKGESFANGNLQSLSKISVESCGEEIVQMSPNLKKLGIRGNLSNILDGNLFLCLSKLAQLENLKLVNENSKLQSLHEIKFPKRLTSLTLSNTSLNWEHMSTLGKLEFLEVLKLKDNAFVGDSWETKEEGFPNLKVLYIGATNLLTWEASEDHFPKLESLFLRQCTKLGTLPYAIADMLCLRNIDIYCCNPRLAASGRKLSMLKQELGESFKLAIYPPDD